VHGIFAVGKTRASGVGDGDCAEQNYEYGRHGGGLWRGERGRRRWGMAAEATIPR